MDDFKLDYVFLPLFISYLSNVDPLNIEKSYPQCIYTTVYNLQTVALQIFALVFLFQLQFKVCLELINISLGVSKKVHIIDSYYNEVLNTEYK